MTIEEVNQVLQVLVNAINIAQKRGTYSLEESAAIYAAIQSFSKREETDAEDGADETPTELEET